MIAIPGYELLQKVYESPTSIVYRSLRIDDDLPIILKILNEEYPSTQEIIRYRQEFKITRSLKYVPGVINVYGLERYRNTLVMALEDLGAASLKYFMKSRRFELRETLTIAIRLCEILAEIHSANVIHKDINPSNIVYNSTTDQLRVIDFGIASALTRENPLILSPDDLEGTLPYISPEQTGRMNRSLDYRSDYYSLGVTLYELLTGRVPFIYTDSAEILHCHIAKAPAAPTEVNSSIGEAISAIVLKLLAKNAEDRYQSATGIKADLEECVKQLDASGAIQPFVLALQDVPQRFDIPQKLYGRELQIKTVMESFDLTAKGKKQIIFISGPAGIGKTSLVKEIHKPLTGNRGYFISGKFDQLQRNQPYLAILLSLRDLLKQIITEKEDRLTGWREKILAALGPNGRILTDLIPELELIIGAQPPAAEVGLNEARNRFQMVMQRFIRVFCSENHPLVIFLDDLQWMDAASLDLMKWLIADADSPYLLLIGAYRDNQVLPSHPLARAIDEFHRDGQEIRFIELGPLSSEDVLQLCTETLHRDRHSVARLADLVFRKTGGNPFHIKEFLKVLYVDKLLDYNHAAGRWRWNLAEIRERGATDNVVELMTARIQKLQADTQEALKLASCIGNQFDLKTLANVLKNGCKETLQLLWPALVEDLILSFGNAWKRVEFEVPEYADEATAEFKFCHDRVQQATYSLIADHLKPSVHLHVGRLLLNSTESEKLEEKILDIAYQLNRGAQLIHDKDECEGLAELNLQAGRKAKASTAYDIAYDYFTAGIGLLVEEAWKSKYRLLLDLHNEAVETAYLTGDFAAMDKFAGTVLSRGKTVLDKVKTYETLVLAHIARSRPLEAIRTALPVLAELGVRFPASPRKLHVLFAFLKTNLALAGKRIEDLAELPMMENPKILAAMRISSSISSAAYIAIPELFPLIIFKQLRLSMQYGNAAISPFTYANYGLILCAVFGALDRGYRFGSMALRLADDIRFTEVRAKTYFIVNTFIAHFKDHIRDTLPLLLDAHASGMQNGDLEFASYATTSYGYNAYCMGKPLAELESELAVHSRVSREFKQEGAFNHKQLYRQAIANLTSTESCGKGLSGDHYDEWTMLPIIEQTKDSHAVANLYFLKLHLGYIFGKYRDAILNADKAEEYLDSIRGFITYVDYHFYDSLARLAIYRKVPRSEKWKIRRRVAQNQRRLQKWANCAEQNYLNKYCLVEAERLRVFGGDLKAAEELFERAIELAKTNEYIHEEALANELTGRFYLAMGKSHIARAYLWEARYCYARWGASAKVRHMYESYHTVLEPMSPAKNGFSKESSITTTYTIASEIGKGIDLHALMKASQTLSEEIVLDRLLERLMGIMMENAGAERGFLILETNRRLLIEAQGEEDGEVIKVGMAKPVAGSEELSPAIIHYVMRTGKKLVLDEATKEGPFVRDPYVIVKQPMSILCTPLLHQGKVSGILYLENNRSKGAFTPERIEILRLLSSHAAISINSARLYADLERYAKKVKAAEEKYRGIVENAIMGIFQLAPDGGILSANPSAAKILGYSSPEELMSSITDVGEQLSVNPERGEQFFRTLREEGQLIGFEAQLYRQGGTTCWVSVSAKAFQDSLGSLQYYEGSFYDISKRKQAEQELSAYQEQLRKLASEVAMAEERERRRIAEDLHDSVTQTLAMSAFRLKNLPKSDDIDGHTEELNEIIELLDQSLVDTRSLTFELSPPVLYDYGLEAALEWLAGHIKERYGLLVVYDENGEGPELDDNLKVTLYRAARELLINVAKHAHAHVAEMAISKQEGRVTITVADDGSGFDEDGMKEQSSGFGLFSIRERLKLLGGDLEIECRLGQGSLVTLTVPLDKQYN